MVTLKNNFGVEPDKDSVGMNTSEGSGNDVKSSGPGQPKAILISRKNSHPFQPRTLILNTPAKIGRSVARARPSNYNGIFDCKVLSRNHAIIWYEYDSGKFMIQDTKSSNGTFVNNQRLSKGGETSLPREFFSRDIVQFGVDVLENQRKVTHGCIVATVRLVHPNGKESFNTPNPMSSIQMTPNQEKICKLEFIIYEAQQREGRLHDKLEELQLIIGKLEMACQETLTSKFEETRLLSKIANLEKQTKVMSKIMSGASNKTSEKVEEEVQQLLVDIEKVQSVAREIQEKQHRKLLESEQKLLEAQRVASNLELEVIALREQASLTQLQLQEMGAKCTEYCQTIDILKVHYNAQKDVTQKLEAWMLKLEERDNEKDFKSQNLSEITNLDGSSSKLITEEEEKEGNKKDKENQEIVLERSKIYEEFEKIEEKDFNNDDNKTEWLTKQLEVTLTDVEKSKKKLEKLCVRSHALSLELNAAKIPAETDNEFDGDLYKPLNLPSMSLLNKARFKQRELEGQYSTLKSELVSTIKRCVEFISNYYKLSALLRNHIKSIEETGNEYKEKLIKLEGNAVEKVQEQDGGDDDEERENKKMVVEKNVSKKFEPKETQTMPLLLITSSTNTEIDAKGMKNVTNQEEKETEDKNNIKTSENLIKSSKKFEMEEEEGRENKSENLGELNSENLDVKNISEINLIKQIEYLYDRKTKDTNLNTLGFWEKIQKIQNVLTNKLKGEPEYEINEMKNLINLLAEDLVCLLLREQKLSRENQSLQKKINKCLSECDVPSVGLAVCKT
ncbi:Rho-associated protein kinase, putative [Pediculus humanus corporis]|uniref:Sarcolemmal membrane-associated protein n=1 Tax=Pediculus humanus subsp. corporis TaxID=121224 RepID=E0VB56_PEDHC|nr:Rho-associated protein kinase, putative [Pediculus humanus corporis]EEB10612.1 Rho-associated protein kinase, putative [Pediculus humanus corporis]